MQGGGTVQAGLVPRVWKWLTGKAGAQGTWGKSVRDEARKGGWQIFCHVETFALNFEIKY